MAMSEVRSVLAVLIVMCGANTVFSSVGVGRMYVGITS